LTGAPVELTPARREHARDATLLVDEARLAVAELHDLEVPVHDRARLLHEEVDARVLELRHREVVELDLEPAERRAESVHTRLEHPLEATLTER
jgi:hypothetical protein